GRAGLCAFFFLRKPGSTLYAFDATCRKACQPLWSFPFPNQYINQYLPNSPTIAGGLVYIVGSGGLYAFDATCRKACHPIASFKDWVDRYGLAIANGLIYMGNARIDIYGLAS
ncbi:MAG: PQQ-binding-like beta-propeller repeat protein, partial [Ktedonobacteraceae bacterium]|nr:PQQ-binding-like beta-propeller repeat protein [Ktedonobacteraceae bacterium]